MSPSWSSLMKRLLPNISPGARLQNEHGFALLLSLLIVVLLVVIIFEADHQIRADLRAAGNFRDDLKAEFLARSGISAGEALLKEDSKISPGHDGLEELWASPIPEYPLGDGFLSGFIVDEERKINVNTLVITNNAKLIVDQTRKQQLQRLFTLLDVNPDLVDAIGDWLDTDDVPQPYGAESPTYRSRDPAYSARNGKMQTLQELHMIQGITNEIYNTISPYLTVYGEGKLNVNTADSLVLQSLDEGIDETEARRMIENRPFEQNNAQDFKDEVLPEEIKERMRTDGRIHWFTKDSTFFTLKATGHVNETFKTAIAVVNRQGGLTKLFYFRLE